MTLTVSEEQGLSPGQELRAGGHHSLSPNPHATTLPISPPANGCGRPPCSDTTVFRCLSLRDTQADAAIVLSLGLQSREKEEALWGQELSMFTRGSGCPGLLGPRHYHLPGETGHIC